MEANFYIALCLFCEIRQIYYETESTNYDLSFVYWPVAQIALSSLT